MRVSLSLLLALFGMLATLAWHSVDAAEQQPRKLVVQTTNDPLPLRTRTPDQAPAYVATFRVHSATITYAWMFDDLVGEEFRDRMFFKGFHIFFPSRRVAYPLADVVLKRRSELPTIRIPTKNLHGVVRPLVPRQPPTRLTKEQQELAKQLAEFEKRAIALLSTPIVAVWGLRTSDGSPDDYLVLYANGRSNDPGGKVSWDWRDNQLTVIFPGKQYRLSISKDGQSVSGNWVGGPIEKGRLLGFGRTNAIPVLATWIMRNARGIVSVIKLYANGRVNDQHAKAAWPWVDAKLTIAVDGNAAAAEFTVDPGGSQLKGGWEGQAGIIADMHNPVVAFVPTEPSELKPNDPKLWASLTRKTTDYFKLLVSDVPEDKLPPPDVVTFFTKEANDDTFQILPLSETDVEFRIVAPTQAHAEARACGVLAIYDHGAIAPAARLLQERMKAFQDQLKEQVAEVARLEKELADDLKDPAKKQAAESKLARPRYHVGKTGRIIGAHSHVIRRYTPFNVVDQEVVIAPVKWETSPRDR